MDPWAMLLLLLSFVALIIGYPLMALLTARGKKELNITARPLPAFQDLHAETSHAAERGGTMHIALGGGSLYGQDAMTSLAALQVVESLADAAVAHSAPPIVTVGDPTLFPLAQDALRRACERRGLPELYDPSCVRFVAPGLVAYAAGAADVTAMENVTTSMAIGAFGAEVSLISDASARREIPQLAAAATPAAIGALYPATERLAWGEELYVAGAAMTEKRPYIIGIVAQDILRVVLVLAIFGAAIAAIAP